MSNWMDRWLLKLNVDKCKMVSYGRNVLINASYNLKQSVLKEKTATTIWVLNLTPNFDCHINEKINKTDSILGIIKRNFPYLSQECFVTLYKSLVRSHLEYANCVWSPHHKELIKK